MSKKTEISKESVIDIAKNTLERLEKEMRVLMSINSLDDDALNDISLIGSCVSKICIIDPERSHLFVPAVLKILQANPCSKKEVVEMYEKMKAHDEAIDEARKKSVDPTETFDEYSVRNHADIIFETADRMWRDDELAANVLPILHELKEVVIREKKGLLEDVAEKWQNTTKAFQTLSNKPKNN